MNTCETNCSQVREAASFRIVQVGRLQDICGRQRGKIRKHIRLYLWGPRSTQGLYWKHSENKGSRVAAFAFVNPVIVNTVGPLIIESLCERQRVSTGALRAPDDLLVVQMKV